MGPWEVLALGAEEQEVGVLVRVGTGASCFPLDTSGVGSKLACTGAWECLGIVHAWMAGLAGWLIAWSFWIAAVTVVSVLSNISSTQAVSLSAGLSGVSKVLVPWRWTAQLLRYTQQYWVVKNLTSFP